MSTLSLPDLPVVPILEKLGATLATGSTAILTAPPGTGKTTLAPLFLLGQPWLRGRKIILLEPRRLAARAAAARMADLIGEPLGERVGYQVRFDRCIGQDTRIEVVTEGILTRRLQGDPELGDVGLVIFDEFHERSLHADLGLALCLDLLNLREDLRILVMSATLRTKHLSRLMNRAPVLNVESTPHPVTIHYLDRQPGDRLERGVVQAIRRAVDDDGGDMLVFLPGAGEIHRLETALETGLPEGVEVLPLHGQLMKQHQDRAVAPRRGGPRRIILATDIAETSLTIPGVTIVIDGGLCRRPKFHAASGLTRLETVRISKASADQRAGRAGRLGPGACYRLWSRGVQEGLQTATPPEIADADLTTLLLELAVWGVSDVESLAWLDIPPKGAVGQARELLQKLDAVDADGRVTARGRKMAELPLHPRLAHMVLMAGSAKEKELACQLAAILGERDPLRAAAGERSVDIGDRLRLLTLMRNKGVRAVAASGGDPAICARIERAVGQFRRLLGLSKGGPAVGEPGVMLAAAFPDRVAQRRPGQRNRYRLAGGRGARLPEGDPLTVHSMIVAAELDAGQGEGRVYRAAALQEADLRERFSPHIHWRSEVRWDARQSRVVARRVQRFGALELSERLMEKPDPEAVRMALLDGIRGMGLDCLNWNDEARSVQARLARMRQWQPRADWPDLSDRALLAGLDHWLGPWLDGINRLEQLQRLNLAAILLERLSWRQRQQLDQEVPTHIRVPSGSRLRLRYSIDGPPVLAVRMQELFGLADTPRLCGGTLPVTLHLLSPARRPVQVTDDLSGFWRRTWPQVRKELLGRYPKHHWPENPWTARATARAKPGR